MSSLHSGQRRFSVKMTEQRHGVFQLFAVPGSRSEAEERIQLERSLATRLAMSSLSDAVSVVESKECLCDEIFATLTEWVRRKPSFWSREIGHLWRAVHYRDTDAIVGSLIDLAIQASVAGVPASLEFGLPKPTSLRLQSVVLDSVQSGCIECKDGTLVGSFYLANDHITVEVQDGQRCMWRSLKSRERPLPAPSFSVLHDQFRLIPSLLASLDLLPEHGRVESEYDNGLVESGVVPSASALRLLHRYWSEGYEWVSTVVREIIPLRSRNGGAGSTSSFWDCGTIAATLGTRQNPILLAEMLVHEASHQHFFLAKQLGPLEDGSDATEYFSPMVNAFRSLEKMLLGYHALINMLKFYEKVSADCSHDSEQFLSARVSYLFEKLDLIGTAISRSTAFTPGGSCMFQRLREEEHLLRADFARWT